MFTHKYLQLFSVIYALLSQRRDSLRNSCGHGSINMMRR